MSTAAKVFWQPDNDLSNAVETLWKTAFVSASISCGIARVVKGNDLLLPFSQEWDIILAMLMWVFSALLSLSND